MKVITNVVMGATAFGMITAIGMVIASFVLGDPTEFHWATISDDGQVQVECEAEVLPHANIELDAISRFAVDAVINANSYNYLSWDKVVPITLDAYFAPRAAQVYLDIFSQSQLLRVVQKNYFESTAVSTFPAVITSEGKATGGRRTWTVQVPATVFFTVGAARDGRPNVEQTVHQIFTVEMIEQRPTPENFRGMAITGMSSKRVDGQREFFRLNTKDRV